MNLADKIIANRDIREERRKVALDFKIGEVDDCGIPVPEEATYDYLCARTMKMHPRLYQKNGVVKEVGLAVPYKKDIQTAMQLVGLPSELLKKGGHVVYWRRLLQLLPYLSEDYLQVSDNLLWDKDKGKLIRRK